jgi:hypothetical protein
MKHGNLNYLETTNSDLGDVICRTCSTCGHKLNNMCMLGGYAIIYERRYPTKCGQNFENWTPKPPRIRMGLKKRLLSFWYGTI